jgi:hypothetical protein
MGAVARHRATFADHNERLTEASFSDRSVGGAEAYSAGARDDHSRH